MMPIWILPVLASAVLLSVISAAFAWSCRPGNHRHTSTEKRLREVEADQADLQDGWGKVLAQLKRINQREVMRDRRAAEIEQPGTDELSDDEWKAKMAGELLQKQMRV